MLLLYRNHHGLGLDEETDFPHIEQGSLRVAPTKKEK